VKLVDANVLLYAVNESVDKHDESREWLDGTLNSREPVGLSWITLLAFLRLSTKVGLFPSPLSVAEALDRVRLWQQKAELVEPTTRHLAVLSGLLESAGTGGNLVSDAHLAALAVEHDATIVTYDSDFSRFTGVRSCRPTPPTPNG
jgi:uncharacterized protein